MCELLDSPPAGNSSQEGLRARKPHKSYPPQPWKTWNEHNLKAAQSNGQNENFAYISQTPNNCTHLPTRNSLNGRIGMDGGSGGCSNKPYLCDNMFHKSKQPDQTLAWKESKLSRNDRYIQFSVACGRIGQGGKQAIPFSGLVPSYLGLYFDLIRYKDSLLGMTKVQSQTYHSWSKTVPLTAPIRYLENIQFQLGLKEEPMINSHLQKASLPNRKGEKWTMN